MRRPQNPTGMHSRDGIAGVITFGGRPHHRAIREATLFAFGVHLPLIGAISGFLLTAPKGRLPEETGT